MYKKSKLSLEIFVFREWKIRIVTNGFSSRIFAFPIITGYHYVLSALRAYFAKSGETVLLNERASLDAIRDARKRTNNGIERQREDGIQL